MREIINIRIPFFNMVVRRAADMSFHDQPVALASAGGGRAIIRDVSPEAMANGIYPGMSVKEAGKLLPCLVVIFPEPGLYSRILERIIKIVSRFSPAFQIEPDSSIYIDVTGTEKLYGKPLELVAKLKKEIEKYTGLEPVFGVGSSKLVTGLATKLMFGGEAGNFLVERGVSFIAPGKEGHFMEPVPTGMLPRLSENARAIMREFNIRFVRELLPFTVGELGVLFGKEAFSIFKMARGLDNEPVRSSEDDPRLLSYSKTLEKETNDIFLLENALFELVEQAGRELRAGRLAAGKLVLEIIYSDGPGYSGHVKLEPPCFSDKSLFNHARNLFMSLYTRRIALRSICLRLDELESGFLEMELFGLSDEEKKAAISGAIDSIRKKYGYDAIREGRFLVCPHTVKKYSIKQKARGEAQGVGRSDKGRVYFYRSSFCAV